MSWWRTTLARRETFRYWPVATPTAEFGEDSSRVDELTIHRGLPADRLQARAIKERWQQWMPVERLIQSGDRPRGALEGAGERGVNANPGTDGVARLLHGSFPSGFQVHPFRRAELAREDTAYQRFKRKNTSTRY
jgi:hypothetical protein